MESEVSDQVGWDYDLITQVGFGGLGSMPLKAGKSQATISENISELESSQTKAGKGRSHKQNVAIALSKARESGARIPKPSKKVGVKRKG